MNWDITDVGASPGLAGQFLLVVNDRMFFIVTQDDTRYSDLGRVYVGTIAAKEIYGEEYGSPIFRNRFPSAVLATNDELFLGYDSGEWRGAAFVLPLGEKGPSKEYLDTPAENVRVMVRDAQGTVWIGCGLMHMGGESAHLIRCRQGDCETLINQDALEGRIFPRQDTVILDSFPPHALCGLTLSPDGHPVILTSGIRSPDDGRTMESHLDVVEWSDGKVRSLVSATFGHTFLPWSFPEAIVMEGEDIYVAHSRLGIFKFTGRGRGRSLAPAGVRRVTLGEGGTGDSGCAPHARLHSSAVIFPIAR